MAKTIGEARNGIYMLHDKSCMVKVRDGNIGFRSGTNIPDEDVYWKVGHHNHWADHPIHQFILVKLDKRILENK